MITFHSVEDGMKKILLFTFMMMLVVGCGYKKPTMDTNQYINHQFGYKINLSNLPTGWTAQQEVPMLMKFANTITLNSMGDAKLQLVLINKKLSSYIMIVGNQQPSSYYKYRDSIYKSYNKTLQAMKNNEFENKINMRFKDMTIEWNSDKYRKPEISLTAFTKAKMINELQDAISYSYLLFYPIYNDKESAMLSFSMATNDANKQEAEKVFLNIINSLNIDAKYIEKDD